MRLYFCPTIASGERHVTLAALDDGLRVGLCRPGEDGADQSWSRDYAFADWRPLRGWSDHASWMITRDGVINGSTPFNLYERSLPFRTDAAATTATLASFLPLVALLVPGLSAPVASWSAVVFAAAPDKVISDIPIADTVATGDVARARLPRIVFDGFPASLSSGGYVDLGLSLVDGTGAVVALDVTAYLEVTGGALSRSVVPLTAGRGSVRWFGACTVPGDGLTAKVGFKFFSGTDKRSLTVTAS